MPLSLRIGRESYVLASIAASPLIWDDSDRKHKEDKIKPRKGGKSARISGFLVCQLEPFVCPGGPASSWAKSGKEPILSSHFLRAI